MIALHYATISHANPRTGAEKAGAIVVDFTFLRDEGLIQPIDGGVNEQGRRIGKRHYRVTFTMVIRVVDRDLQCESILIGRTTDVCRTPNWNNR